MHLFTRTCITRTILLASLGATGFAAGQENPCVAVYKGAVQQLEYASSDAATASFVARNACAGQNRSFTLGFDSETNALVESVPVVSRLMTNLGATSNKTFCDRYENREFSSNSSERLVIAPLEHAHQSFNQCISIYSRDRIEITHEIASPELVSVFIRIPAPDRKIEIQTIETTGGFNCRRPASSPLLSPAVDRNEQHYTLERSEVITCRRAAHATDSGEFAFPDATIQLGTSSGIYTIQIPENTIFGPRSKQEAGTLLLQKTAEIQDLNRVIEELIQGYDDVRAESIGFYFGSMNIHDPQLSWGGRHYVYRSLGQHFDCATWNQGRQVWEAIVTERLCPDADKTVISERLTYGGDACGYNLFNLTCTYLPAQALRGSFDTKK